MTQASEKTEDDGNAPCLVAKGKCGHYYYATTDADPTTMSLDTVRELAKIKKRGDSVELKPVNFVRQGGLNWTPKCRKGLCGGIK